MILRRKNILITGAGKGIGFDSVKNCIREGAFVYALITNKNDKKKFNIFHKNSYKVIVGNVNNNKLILKTFKDSIKYSEQVGKYLQLLPSKGEIKYW